SFFHAAATDLPQINEKHLSLRLIVGSLLGERSPVPVRSPMFYADVQLAAGARFTLPPEHEERAAYVAEGSVEVDGKAFDTGRMLVFEGNNDVILSAAAPARILLLGGAPIGPRPLCCNL